MPSTVISAMQYDVGSATLRIIFVSGTIYEYQDVPPQKYQAMLTTVSKGKFLNKFIKRYHPFKKIK